MAHTPGDWYVSYYRIFVNERKGPEIIATTAWNAQMRTPEAEANARLMAASPKMLDALQRIAESSGDPIIENIANAAIELALAAPAAVREGP